MCVLESFAQAVSQRKWKLKIWRHCENCIPWLWPNFLMSNASKVNISKTIRTDVKVHQTTFADFDICHRITTLRKMYSVRSLDLLIEGQTFETLITRKRWVLKNEYKDFINLIFANKWNMGKVVHKILIYFFKVKNLKCWTVPKCKMTLNTKKLKNICVLLKCIWSLRCSCTFSSTCTVPADELLLVFTCDHQERRSEQDVKSNLFDIGFLLSESDKFDTLMDDDGKKKDGRIEQLADGRTKRRWGCQMNGCTHGRTDWQSNG